MRDHAIGRALLQREALRIQQMQHPLLAVLQPAAAGQCRSEQVRALWEDVKGTCGAAALNTVNGVQVVDDTIAPPQCPGQWLCQSTLSRLL